MSETEVLNLLDRGGVVAVLIIAIVYFVREKNTVLKELHSSIYALQQSNNKVVEAAKCEVEIFRQDLRDKMDDLLNEMKKTNEIMLKENEFLKKQNEIFMNILVKKDIKDAV
ncbi:TPA: hypothetical protein R8I27_001651 [Campylobacter jejuni]|nr:hypothetical protein [Campylobacter jejuni]HED5116006.1 hypothetical protein [Campylobacter jejuni]HEF3610590.1 hypothetical protein [Campylobacter jejuni]HEF3625105.1 hypothetical protein [Campylobacter jejuni]HEG8200789.1 hypothetical protein [Campylobacter jejuni]